MSTLTTSLYLLLIGVCFNHALPARKPSPATTTTTTTTRPLPMALRNNRPVMKMKTADMNWPKKAASTAAIPRPIQEPATMMSRSMPAESRSVVAEPPPPPSTRAPKIGQWLRDVGVTLSPTNEQIVNMLDRIDFDSLERMCRQRAGLTQASNIVRDVLGNQRGANMIGQIQSQAESMSADAMFCSFLGKLGSPDRLFNDLENILSGVIPLKQTM
uniref:Uncharacterized protein n=1 Tax=Plectus sambesii TaxID=2011161 RepID=A0A914V116_9BILA